eukprot:m.186422 g.186422  ORF g.186422 m.186422 type:complete len:123 (+) comp32268_c1_seq3:120-488(+)
MYMCKTTRVHTHHTPHIAYVKHHACSIHIARHTSHITHHTPHIINQSARRYPSTHRTYTHTPTHTHAPTATKHTSTHANNHSRDGVIAISSGTHVVLSLLMTGFEGQKGHPQACCLEQTIML